MARGTPTKDAGLELPGDGEVRRNRRFSEKASLALNLSSAARRHVGTGSADKDIRSSFWYEQKGRVVGGSVVSMKVRSEVGFDVALELTACLWGQGTKVDKGLG